MRLENYDDRGGWIELRGPGELVAADDDAWRAVYADLYAEGVQAQVDEGGDGMEVSPDGVSMTPKRRLAVVPRDLLARQRDALLGGLITAWSYSDPGSAPQIGLPYSAECRKVLPLAAWKALDAAIRPHVEAITAAGPKETTAASGTSASG
jgi:hypothetical protein